MSINVFGYLPPEKFRVADDDDDGNDDEEGGILNETVNLNNSFSVSQNNNNNNNNTDSWNIDDWRPEIYPIKIAKKEKQFHANLLLVSDSKEHQYHCMYVCIDGRSTDAFLHAPADTPRRL